MPLTHAFAAIAAMIPAPDARPVTLEAIPFEGGVELKVIGAAEAPAEVSYTLEAEGGTGNRSRQGGRANLQPGQPATLLHLRVSTGGTWRARLIVTPAGAAPYEQVAGSTPTD